VSCLLPSAGAAWGPLQDALNDAEDVIKNEGERNGIKFYDYEIKSPVSDILSDLLPPLLVCSIAACWLCGVGMLILALCSGEQARRVPKRVALLSRAVLCCAVACCGVLCRPTTTCPALQ
jgi:hypothetical protein